MAWSSLACRSASRRPAASNSGVQPGSGAGVEDRAVGRLPLRSAARRPAPVSSSRLRPSRDRAGRGAHRRAAGRARAGRRPRPIPILAVGGSPPSPPCSAPLALLGTGPPLGGLGDREGPPRVAPVGQRHVDPLDAELLGARPVAPVEGDGRRAAARGPPRPRASASSRCRAPSRRPPWPRSGRRSAGAGSGASGSRRLRRA